VHERSLLQVEIIEYRYSKEKKSSSIETRQWKIIE